MKIGDNYISDIYEATVDLKNNTSTTIKWYQFKIPIRKPDQVIGSIQDFKSIRFLRIFMRGFNEEILNMENMCSGDFNDIPAMGRRSRM